jgi:hypothetical protein
VAGVAAGLQVGPKIVEAERTGAFLQVPIAAAIGRKAARKDQPTRRLCCLWVCPCVAGPAGDHDVEPGDHRRLEEPGALAAHRAQADQLGERVGAEHEPPDVDRPVAPGDVGDDDVEPGTVAQGGVDERAGEVDPAAAGPEHELDQVVDVLLAEHGGGQLGPSGLGHEHLARFVDPDLLDVRVVEEGLERAHADHPVGHRLGHLPGVGQRGHARDQPPVGVVGDHFVDELAHGDRVAVARVEPAPSDQLADLDLDDLVGGLLPGRRHDGVPVAAVARPATRLRRRARRGWAAWAGNRTAASLARASWAGHPGRASRSAWPARSAASRPGRS